MTARLPTPQRSDASPVPVEVRPFLAFARALLDSSFSVAPEQVTTFLKAISLLGPRSMEDIRQAGIAALAPPPDRKTEFDAIFRAIFYGEVATLPGGGEDEDANVRESGGAREERDETLKKQTAGEMTSALEQLAVRSFDAVGNDTDAIRFVRSLSRSLPVRRSFRRLRTKAHGQMDLRRSLRSTIAADGDVPKPAFRRRKSVTRRVVMLIDISGSMKQHTADYMTVAHDIMQATDHAEIFTFGTRLTRITGALRVRDRELALARASEAVDDWDGGTRIGTSLLSFLAIPRFAAFARGSVVVLLTDGLERGDHTDMEKAIRRLATRAFRLSLLTPLAGDPRFRPGTAALSAILPLLDDLADGSSIARIRNFVLTLGRQAPSAEEIWRRRTDDRYH
ncbi:VWA domain-containing protein [Rhizobiaceae bacterium n13]|uniref:VWA domain-containing protein n=1 Tax=Ferirhizobium litorale TaxID=2927786 RepID=A0AAE3QDV5_9HYPH|nr:VWA domain-containing protein [Fererhizobium litorale]MDI7861630.1 VWA domain-containing protein [Fererhizobium litorale]MDI7922028.1 VWA domain-containing protein [Fererhizobium litorale]